MGNKRKALNSIALVELKVVHYQSHEPKVALDKNRFVSIEAQMFYDKLALIASPCLERGINFYGLDDDKINNLTAPGKVRRAFLFEIFDRTWSRFVREDATVGNDTIVRKFIANTHKLIGIVVQDLIAKQQPMAQAEQVVLNSQNHGQQGTWELPLLVHPDYVFRQLHTEAELCSLAVYHSRSLHALYHKLDILTHQLHPAQPLNLANWSLEPDAPSWHFGPRTDDEY
ncbi:hypothetical protein ACH5RR_017737 [Cinchona calisaya]|uniref:Uncharacterized protein n=1 Tax=Cinchona calisaya TaxID=153742 RepID=A0ABD2ZPE6_9GENT